MKPKEFDDLIRQKFDQNDFAYNPRNWDKLAEELDGRAKKRSIIMWWLMPLAGVAASVALAMGVSPALRQATPAGINTEVAKAHNTKAGNVQNTGAVTASSADLSTQIGKATKTGNMPQGENEVADNEMGEEVHINLLNAIPNLTNKQKANINLLKTEGAIANKKEDKKQQPEIVSTFKPEAEQKAPKISVILNGGYNTGSVSTGYLAGATVRRMLNDKIYIESDVDFLGSDNVQTNGHQNSKLETVYANGNSSARTGGANNTGARTTGGSGTSTNSAAGGSSSTSGASKTTDGNTLPTAIQVVVPDGPLENMNLSYEMNYVQVSPSIGVRITRKLSIGAGPDMQQALSDKRPATDPTDQNVQLQAPLFDLGLMGKSEYAVTKKVKAGLYYRKGINNLLTPDKYTERNYMQFQIKYTIFNK